MKIKKQTIFFLVVFYVITVLILPILVSCAVVDYDKICPDTQSITMDVSKDKKTAVVFLTLPTKSLIDIYQQSGSALSYSQYLTTKQGKEQRAQLMQQVDKLSGIVSVLGGEVRNTYVDITVGISAKVDMVDLPQIQNATGTKVFANIEFSAKQLQTTTNFDDAETTNDHYADFNNEGIFKNDTPFKGDGMLVAVIDTGFNLNHDCLQDLSDTKVKLTSQKVKGLWEQDQLVSSQMEGVEELAHFGVYHDNKVPYAFDYDGKDFDVFSASAGHGMHVAGIVGGNDANTVVGVAPNCQLALMKVFDDKAITAGLEEIMSALSDCAVLGADVANLSLGVASGLSMEYTESNAFINQCMLKVYEAGVIICSASGNDYYSGYGSVLGDTSSAYPDNGLLASTASYISNYAVASINAYASKYILIDGINKVFTELFVDENSKTYEFDDIIFNDGTTPTVAYDYLYVGLGRVENYVGKDVKGKFVVVDRGIDNFSTKHNVAREQGAVGMIIINNVYGPANFMMDTVEIDYPNKSVIPSFIVSKTDGEFFDKTDVGGQITFSQTNACYLMSDFSSWGPNGDLTLKPEITAFGGKVLSASIDEKDISNNSFMEYNSGTSMSAPNVSALCALVKQYLKTLDAYKNADDRQLAQVVKNVLSSTATPVYFVDGSVASVRHQGAGLANVKNATSANAYLESTFTGQPKLELGDDVARSGKYTLDVLLTNFGGVSKTYTVTTVVNTAKISSDNTVMTTSTYSLDFSAVVFVDGVEKSQFTTTATANSINRIKVKITLSNSAKQYLSKYPNGCYVEGFLTMSTADGETLSLPWLAYYGDWSDIPSIDISAFDTQNQQTYIGAPMLYDNNKKVLGQNLADGDESTVDMFKLSLSTLNTNTERTKIAYIDLPITRTSKNLYLYASTASGEQMGTKLKVYRTLKSMHKLQYERISFAFDLAEFPELKAGDTVYLWLTTESEYYKANTANSIQFSIYLDGSAPVIDANNLTLMEQNGRVYLQLSVKEDFELMYIKVSFGEGYVNIPCSLPNRNVFGDISVDVTDYILNSNTVLEVSACDYALNISIPIKIGGGV